MKTIDSQLRQSFVQATDEVIPPAPWLETQVVDALRQRRRVRPRWRDLGAIGGFGPGLRLAAGLVALLIAVAGVAVLMVSARSHTSTVPGGTSTTIQTPSPSPTATFRPSPAVRASYWPPGEPVPAQLAGSWQSQISSRQIDLGGYTFQPRDASGCACDSGNVEVSASAIYFMTDTCTPSASLNPVNKFGYEKYSYTLTGTTLILVRAPDPGQSNCGFSFQGSYTRIASS
jgi:hypothetical protein